MYGSSDQWIGLGVFFDSFDNDNKHNNPYIMAMTNDGTKHFDHQNDGSTQQIAGCLRDFRSGAGGHSFDYFVVLLARSRLAETPGCWSLEFQLDATLADNFSRICRQIVYICNNL